MSQRLVKEFKVFNSSNFYLTILNLLNYTLMRVTIP